MMHPDTWRNELTDGRHMCRRTRIRSCSALNIWANMSSLPAQQRHTCSSTLHWMNQAQNNSAAQSHGLEGIAGTYSTLSYKELLINVLQLNLYFHLPLTGNMTPQAITCQGMHANIHMDRYASHQTRLNWICRPAENSYWCLRINIFHSATGSLLNATWRTSLHNVPLHEITRYKLTTVFILSHLLGQTPK